MRLQLVLMIIQKTKSVELFCPAQHFCFHYSQVTDTKNAVSCGFLFYEQECYANTLIIFIFLIIIILIIEEVLEFIVFKFKVIIITTSFFARGAGAFFAF